MKRWRGVKNLVADAVDATTGLVQSTHDAVRARVVQVADVTGPLAAPTRAVARLEKATSDLVYASVRVTNRVVQATLDVPLALEPDAHPGEMEAAALAALNGAVGHHLEERNNDLGIRMSIRRSGRELDEAALASLGADERVCVFVHGLACTDSFWVNDGASFARQLEADGWRCVFVRYNTGRPVAVNGEELSHRLQPLAAAERLVLIGHSMGGLVARSAVVAGHQGEDGRWLEPTTDVICLGSPHHGAPLEKAGNVLAGLLDAVDLPATKVIAKVLNARSLGIKDLRFGTITESDWGGESVDAVLQNRKRVHPWPPSIRPHFIASTWAADPDHVVARLFGDALVRAGSAGAVGGPEARDAAWWGEDPAVVLGGISHLALAHHPDVFALIVDILARQGEKTASGENREA